ncbi:hypothetical protein HDU85_002020 [Gaertneriomyces sp. JEL0708]|nr:hypothetical protein HDU85_002020 [Gaertneriomyces sp. JEL0708]
MPLPVTQVHLTDVDEAEVQQRLKNQQDASHLEDEVRKQAELELIASETKSDMVRKISAKDADRAMDAEKQRRVMEDTLALAQEELLRKTGAHEAIKLEEEEKQRRIAEERKAVALSDAVRLQNKKAADQLIEEERNRRASHEDLVDPHLAQMKKAIEQDIVHKAHHDEHTNRGGESQAGAYTYHSASRDTSLTPRTTGTHNDEQKGPQQGPTASPQKSGLQT